MYGNPYTLEYFSGGKWYQVPYKKDSPVFTMEGMMLGPADEYAVPNEQGLTVANKRSDDVVLVGYAKLSKGHYRIVKDIMLLNDEDGSVKKTYYLAAEFDL